MRKYLAVMMLISLVVSFSAIAVAGECLPMKKLGRGVANCITSPMELTKGMGDAQDQSGALAGCTWGIFQGAFNVVKRAVVGVYEIATFPVPYPKDYEPIISDPEFFMEQGTKSIQ